MMPLLIATLNFENVNKAKKLALSYGQTLHIKDNCDRQSHLADVYLYSVEHFPSPYSKSGHHFVAHGWDESSQLSERNVENFFNVYEEMLIEARDGWGDQK